MGTGHTPCLKENIRLLDEQVGMFCDSTRDAIKGHVFQDGEPGFVNGGKNYGKAILESVHAWSGAGGHFQAKAPSQIISYVSAHDNLTLWDKLIMTLKPGIDFSSRDEEIVRANKMAAAVYFTCQGRIFFLGGEEAARTKLGDSNSYASGAEINRIDWRRIYEYQDLLSYYQGLIAFRKKMPGLYDKSKYASERIFGEEMPTEGLVCFYVQNSPSLWDTLAIWYNSTRKEQSLPLPEGIWEILVDGNDSYLWKKPSKVQGLQGISPVSVKIFGKRKEKG